MAHQEKLTEMSSPAITDGIVLFGVSPQMDYDRPCKFQENLLDEVSELEKEVITKKKEFCKTRSSKQPK